MTQDTFDFTYLKFLEGRVNARTRQHHYSIREAAALTGLPASTLRYYESIGVIAPVGRGESRELTPTRRSFSSERPRVG